MELLIEKLGKRFDQGFILRNINHHLTSGTHLGIKGLNGSGKSTLMSMIGQRVLPSEGIINYLNQGKLIDMEEHSHLYIASSGPYHHLPEELKIIDIFKIYSEIKLDNSQINEKDFWIFIDLEKHKEKKFNTLSSGMQQRFKLALTIFCKAELFLFDEPGNFLDDYWRQKLYNKMNFVLSKKTTIIASNDPRDFDGCTVFLNLDEIPQNP